MKCPNCNKDDQIFEIGTVEVLYHITNIVPKSEGVLIFSYGACEHLDETYEPDAYPYYCRNCKTQWDYDSINDHYSINPHRS